MKKLFLFIQLLCLCSAYGNIEPYFKPALNKSKELEAQVKNVDFIYVINLDKRPEKFEHCVSQLAPYKIVPYRFSAVNGWELSLSVLNDIGIKYHSNMPTDLWGTVYLPNDNFQVQHEVMHVVDRNYFCHCMSRGAIGIVLSHLSVLQDAYDSGYETVWVMEDDIEVIQNPHKISQMIEKLDARVGKKRWDILFTDQDTKDRNGNYVPCLSFAKRPNFTPQNPSRFAQRYNVGSEFRKIGARYGTYSMIVRRSGMKKILDFFKTYNVFLPFDIDFFVPDTIHLYTVINDIVSTQPRALSDNSAPNYELTRSK